MQRFESPQEFVPSPEEQERERILENTKTNALEELLGMQGGELMNEFEKRVLSPREISMEELNSLNEVSARAYMRDFVEPLFEAILNEESEEVIKLQAMEAGDEIMRLLDKDLKMAA